MKVVWRVRVTDHCRNDVLGRSFSISQLPCLDRNGGIAIKASLCIDLPNALWPLKYRFAPAKDSVVSLDSDRSYLACPQGNPYDCRKVDGNRWKATASVANSSKWPSRAQSSEQRWFIEHSGGISSSCGVHCSVWFEDEVRGDRETALANKS